jgi:ADP-L-glycero-D-manno-heptose 6-epimerase
MILVTGGAGFIGSNLHAALHARGQDAIVVDWLGDAPLGTAKWRNLAAHPPHRLIAPEALDAFLATAPAIDLVYHLGAISETTATDGDLVWATNVELPWRLWQWCAANGARFIYASSASTYGNGAQGFDDDPAALHTLRPLNLYGWSKHAFDLRVQSALQRNEPAPPQWAGLKFFNVFGPNEYHKGSMVSVVKVKFDDVAAGHRPRLFQSEQQGLADGAQSRDFIWIDDIVDVLLWLGDTPDVSGLFNLGTGQARTYTDLAYAVCDAMNVPRAIDFVPMPAALRGQYQSFTQARMDRLRSAGYPGQFTRLEAGIHTYITRYLASGDLYR